MNFLITWFEFRAIIFRVNYNSLTWQFGDLGFMLSGDYEKLRFGYKWILANVDIRKNANYVNNNSEK